MNGTARLVVQTREIEPIDDLLEYADPQHPLAWLRRGEGMVALAGAPTVATLSVDAAAADASGRSRAARLARAWRDLAATADVDDAVGLPGTGLVGFGALAFDDASASASSIVVASALVGRRGGRSWLTRIHDSRFDLSAVELTPTPYGPFWSGTLGPGSLAPEGYQDAVRRALGAIAAGEVSKVVLARDLVATIPAGTDLRRLARALSSEYPDTWTYAVDGIIGASPETLATVAAGTVTARVLAGTASRGGDADADAAASVRLATSAKDLDEHRYAVHSVLEALRPHTTALAASEQPFMLRLPNVWHLATDVEGDLSDAASALDLVAALHPTAAVAGTPTDAALALIRRLEPFDRGRYAGPVGWVDGAGDGEWAIALRCAQFGSSPARASAEHSGTTRVVAHAGAGIVAGSVPESELVETRVKFRPIVDALA